MRVPQAGNAKLCLAKSANATRFMTSSRMEIDMNQYGFDPLDYQAIERRASELRAQAVKDAARWAVAKIRSAFTNVASSFHFPSRVR